MTQEDALALGVYQRAVQRTLERLETCPLIVWYQ
jgi:hypothetical protein